jgi:hypothetical protein
MIPSASQQVMVMKVLAMLNVALMEMSQMKIADCD